MIWNTSAPHVSSNPTTVSSRYPMRTEIRFADSSSISPPDPLVSATAALNCAAKAAATNKNGKIGATSAIMSTMAVSLKCRSSR